MKKRLAYLLCFTLIFTLLASGCQSNTAKKPITPITKKPKQTSEMTPSERRVLANKLSKSAEEVDGVEKATVVIADIGVANNITGNSQAQDQMNRASAKNLNDTTIGSDAGINKSEPQKMIVLVGITLKSGDEDMKDMNRSNRTKTEVMNKLKKHDKRISQVLVTTDPNLVKRIADVATGILEGKPIKNFEKDIKDIDSRVREQGTAAF